MRIKITLLPPFQPQKFLLPVASEEIRTVTHLKKHLIKSISAVAHHAKSAKELVLEIDGFELLGGSQVDIVEATDVVSVKLAPGSSKTTIVGPTRSKKCTSKKRKSVSPLRTQDRSAKKRRLVSAPVMSEPKTTLVPEPSKQQITTRARSLSSSSCSSSSSSASSSSSSSASSSASSSSSDLSSSTSSSSSSSSASSTPLPRPNPRPLQKPFPTLSKTSQPFVPHIPPGQGKPQTQNRNARRRLARQYKKLAAANGIARQADPPAQPVINGESPSLADTAEETGDDVGGVMTFTNPTLPLPREMSNRNKKRGFLKEMTAVKGTKIVFDGGASAGISVNHVNGNGNGDVEASDGQGDVSPDPEWTMEDTTLPNGSEYDHDQSVAYPASSTPRRVKIVPPSQMTDLPSNVFVTSAEFARARSPGRRNGEYWGRNGHASGDAEKGEEEEGVEEAEEKDGPDEEGALNDTSDEALWDRVEREFDNFRSISSGETNAVTVGSLLTCKELELDMRTFSPALKIHIARVILTDQAGIKLQNLVRPGDEQYDEDGQLIEESPTEVMITSEDLAVGKWKLVE
ncbi:hypothetical protein IAR55_005707 [Kwoniella newhampshirensis]|uniref:Coilin n=1 Tax=Kwoniella newhampshirensis TaxID=1651941 RepID=A0AAW0YYC9_9TREE